MHPYRTVRNCSVSDIQVKKRVKSLLLIHIEILRDMRILFTKSPGYYVSCRKFKAQVLLAFLLKGRAFLNAVLRHNKIYSK